MGHFQERCRERGIEVADVDQLFVSLEIAIREKRFDVIDHVLRTDRSDYYRFRCEDGIFYCVTRAESSRPLTVLTQPMMRKKKWAHKKRKRFHTTNGGVRSRSAC